MQKLVSVYTSHENKIGVSAFEVNYHHFVKDKNLSKLPKDHFTLEKKGYRASSYFEATSLLIYRFT